MNPIIADMWAPTEGPDVAILVALVLGYVSLVYGGPIWIIRAKSAKRYWIRVIVGIACLSASAYWTYILRAAWGPFGMFFGIVPAALSAIALGVLLVRVTTVTNEHGGQPNQSTQPPQALGPRG